MSSWHKEWRDFMHANPTGTEVEVLVGSEWLPAKVGHDNSTIYFETGSVPIRFPHEDSGTQSRAYPSRIRRADAIRRLGELADE
jgi:hypothetical protein